MGEILLEKVNGAFCVKRSAPAHLCQKVGEIDPRLFQTGNRTAALQLYLEMKIYLTDYQVKFSGRSKTVSFSSFAVEKVEFFFAN